MLTTMKDHEKIAFILLQIISAKHIFKIVRFFANNLIKLGHVPGAYGVIMRKTQL